MRIDIPAGGRRHLADAVLPVVIVVDDEAAMRAALKRVLRAAGFAVECYASGKEFFAQAKLDRPGCVILDVGMPEMNGLEVQTRLNLGGARIPVVFLTGSADIPIAVAAMREGAADFIEKPFDNELLVARVRAVIERDRPRLSAEEQRQEVLSRIRSLTQREHAVMDLVVAGKTSKEIARSLGCSHRTVEIHRSRAMAKMLATTLADLVRMRLSAGSQPS
ncbi:response regulator [Tahibacter sp.]|uniref:response regulator transcription factor n=1 Tax=Tahibacter sp. TaxID=2056211 RepID=UPI0028C3BFF1|nr:response regulator [Tahibacter sp.]